MAASDQCARDLARLMSEFSEVYWAAGWMIDVEYHLWNLIEDYRHDQKPPRMEWSLSPIVRQAMQVNDACGIWLRWDRDDPAHVLIDDRPIVVMTTEQWLSHLMEKAL